MRRRERFETERGDVDIDYRPRIRGDRAGIQILVPAKQIVVRDFLKQTPSPDSESRRRLTRCFVGKKRSRIVEDQ